MLLVIEDRNDPAGGIAVECDGPGDAALAYIPAIRVLLPCEPAEARRECALERLCYEWRRQGREKCAPSPAAALVPLYLKAVVGTGWQPFRPAPPPMANAPGGRLFQKA